MSDNLFIDLSIEQQEVVAGGLLPFPALIASNTSNYNLKESMHTLDKTVAVGGASSPGGSAGATTLSIKKLDVLSKLHTGQTTNIIVG
jgi:hypothetical protein